MTEPVHELEQAILERADRLAEEYRERAGRSRDNILREASERLKLREDRETLIAKAGADRDYRRRVQSQEQRLRGQMDNLRWNLVTGARDSLKQSAKTLTQDDASYRPVLVGLLAAAAKQLPEGDLVAELSAADLERYRADWTELAKEAAPERTIALSDQPMPGFGGVRLRTPDNRMRMDNSFEGRLARLQRQIDAVILERLFPTLSTDSLR